jgi:hypothetical protein
MMTDDPINDDQDIPPYSTSPSLSINQAVQFMIEGDSGLDLPRAYELVAGGTIFDRLEYCREKAEENYAQHRPDEPRSKIDLEKANHAINTANKYLLALQTALPDAKKQLHLHLQWDEQAAKEMGYDLFLKGSIIAWAYHTFEINPYGLYTPASHPERTQPASSVLSGPPVLHDGPQADEALATPDMSSIRHSEAGAPLESQAHQHMEVTVFLVADALSRHLNTLEENVSNEASSGTRFGNDEGVIDCAEIAAYVIEHRRRTQNDELADHQGPGLSPANAMRTTESILCLLTQTLAELLAKAIEDGDLEVWQDQTRNKMERFIKVDETYNTAAIQRYLSKHILLNKKFPEQAERAIHGRLNAAKAKAGTNNQNLLGITEQGISSCLDRAAGQFGRAKAEAQAKAEAEAKAKALADRLGQGAPRRSK